MVVVAVAAMAVATFNSSNSKVAEMVVVSSAKYWFNPGRPFMT